MKRERRRVDLKRGFLRLDIVDLPHDSHTHEKAREVTGSGRYSHGVCVRLATKDVLQLATAELSRLHTREALTTEFLPVAIEADRHSQPSTSRLLGGPSERTRPASTRSRSLWTSGTV